MVSERPKYDLRPVRSGGFKQCDVHQLASLLCASHEVHPQPRQTRVSWPDHAKTWLSVSLLPDARRPVWLETHHPWVCERGEASLGALLYAVDPCCRRVPWFPVAYKFAVPPIEMLHLRRQALLPLSWHLHLLTIQTIIASTRTSRNADESAAILWHKSTRLLLRGLPSSASSAAGAARSVSARSRHSHNPSP